ncbi:beta-ketoacyl-[acyl-carrier-protein] synthase family protein [Nocardia sp. alder85J]|uniref:beta-ketoacyl-[acyl-carrier-protein] synthase family protein n=1 Tax=Nocardia sp. alder85J TaxID=2862949 RepID=UPI001CD29544|nr:beta-ketoacyl-[acyl-carrier-protein] synthase family protein [Nocardia sp. alder85J]MCX4097502.1 beta-ketoacyl-[acyl-carrier-protein] synthase family protein [Nocardia sp. alder85J]
MTGRVRRRDARDEIAVTGIGLVTPAGIGAEANWRALAGGRTIASKHPALAGQPVEFCCHAAEFDANTLLGRRTAWRLDRFTQIAVAAARQAVDDAGLDRGSWEAARVAVLVGNSLGGSHTWEAQHRNLLTDGVEAVSALTVPMSMLNMVAGAVSLDLGATGPSMVPATACASGANAIGLARDLLCAGTADIVVAGGAESALSPFVMAGLHRLGGLSRRSADPAAASRPFDRDRDGFVAAEAAGILVLERAADAAARHARPRALVRGFAATCDAHHATAPDPEGTAVKQAIRLALADAGIHPGEVDHVNAHGTSTPLNDVTEARAIRDIYGDRPVITSTKGVTGHALGAAGAIEAAFTVLAIESNEIPPTANLDSVDPGVDVDIAHGRPRRMPVRMATSHSFGFGGHNAVLVLSET